MSPPPPHSYDNANTLPLRQALGEFATGVAIVTARGADGSPVGLTVNSFASVSLDPPLVLWSLGLGSTSLASFRGATHFAVNVLTSAQIDISQRFAQSRADKFDGIAWQPGLGGTALLPDCCAWFECVTETRHEGGDHMIFIGRIEQFRRSTTMPVASPLIFHRGAYAALIPH
jgi:flavin reductase (DIM6/NTAB) family NADH-FMN oxidoreductase RutF